MCWGMSHFHLIQNNQLDSNSLQFFHGQKFSTHFRAGIFLLQTALWYLENRVSFYNKQTLKSRGLIMEENAFPLLNSPWVSWQMRESRRLVCKVTGGPPWPWLVVQLILPPLASTSGSKADAPLVILSLPSQREKEKKWKVNSFLYKMWFSSCSYCFYSYSIDHKIFNTKCTTRLQ